MLAIRRAVACVIAATGALTLMGSRVAFAQPAMTDLHPADGAWSRATAINAAGDITGYVAYQTPSGFQQHAVKWDCWGALTIVDPGFVLGHAEGMLINDNAQIVGRLFNGGVFIWDSVHGATDIGRLTTGSINDTDLYPNDLAPNGDIIGSSLNSVGYPRGWFYHNGTLSEVAAPNGDRMIPTLFGPNGEIIGYAYGNYYCAVQWAGGVFTVLTSPWDQNHPESVNSSGQILLSGPSGPYGDWSLRQPTGEIIALGLGGPGGRYSGEVRASGIDDSGRIYGVATSAGINYVWVWQNGVVTERVMPFGLTNTEPSLLFNNTGMTVGNEMYEIFQFRPYMWTPGSDPIRLEGAGIGNDMAMAINDAGTVVGFGDTAAGPGHALAWGVVTPNLSTLEVSDAIVTVRNSKTVSVTVTIHNPGTATAYDTQLKTATWGGVATNVPLPLAFGAIKAGATKKCTLQFKNVPSGDQPLVIEGTCSLGDWFRTQTVNAS